MGNWWCHVKQIRSLTRCFSKARQKKLCRTANIDIPSIDRRTDGKDRQICMLCFFCLSTWSAPQSQFSWEQKAKSCKKSTALKRVDKLLHSGNIFYKYFLSWKRMYCKQVKMEKCVWSLRHQWVCFLTPVYIQVLSGVIKNKPDRKLGIWKLLLPCWLLTPLPATALCIQWLIFAILFDSVDALLFLFSNDRLLYQLSISALNSLFLHLLSSLLAAGVDSLIFDFCYFLTVSYDK